MTILERMRLAFSGSQKATTLERTDKPLPYVADFYTRHAFVERADWDSWASAYNVNPIVQGCVSAYTLTMNEAPLGQLTLEGVEEHGITELIGNSGDLWRQVSAAIAVGGNAYLLKVRKGATVERFVVYSDKQITPVPDALGGVAYYSHYVGNTETRIPPSEIVHLTGFWVDVDKPWRGASPVALASRSIDTYDEATGTIYNVHRNDATPRTVMVYDEELSPDQESLVRASFNRRYGGDNRGSIAHLWGVKDVKQLSLSLDELAMSETFGQLEARICGVYRLHPIVAYTSAGLNASTYSNYKQAVADFTNLARIPLWNLWANQMTAQMQVEYPGVTFAFDTTNIAALQPDANTLATSTVTQFQAGIIDRNEARAVLGYDITEESEPAPDNDNVQKRYSHRVEMKSLEYADFDTIDDATYWTKADERNTQAADAIADDMRKVFRELEREVISNVKALVRKSRAGIRTKVQPFNEDKWVKRALASTEANRTELVEDVIAAALRSIGSDLDEYGDAWSETREAAVDESSNKIAPSIGTIKDEVQDILRANAGESGQTLSVILQSYFDDLATARADAIGRTTATATTGDTQKRTFDEMRSRPGGPKFKRVWISFPDARDAHESANGQAEDKSGLFTVGGERTPYPAGPGLSAGNAVNCRCVTRAKR